MEREIYTFKQDGKFYITDQYDLRRVAFASAEERQKWINGFEPAVGKKTIVREGKPDIMANLDRGLQPRR